MELTSTITRTIEAAHHNGPPGHRCTTNHGHSWIVKVVFQYSHDQLDDYGWGPDFGAIKKAIDVYDHQDLNTMMRHEHPASAEWFAIQLFNDLMVLAKIAPVSVSVTEGSNLITAARSNAG